MTLLAAPSRPSAVPRPENSHSGTGSIRIRVAVNAISELTPKFGSQVYLRELLDELGRMEDIELCILVRAKEREALEQNWRIRRLEVPVPATASYWQVLVQPLIQWRLRRADVQVYHLPNTLPLFRKSVPTVVTIHDLADLRVRKYGHVRTLYRWLINYLSAHLADAVITVSHNSKHDITKLLHVPEHKVAVIYNGVGQAFRPLDRAACIERVRNRYVLSGHFLLCTGGWGGNKNLERLLLAFAELRSSWPGLTLILTGQSSRTIMRKMKKMAMALGLGADVVVTGHVTAAELCELYNACALVVYPSLYEGFGLPVLEAMACGAPVVAANTSCIPEIAGDSAVLVDPYDPGSIAEGVRRVLSDENLRAQLVARGFERASHFTWRRTAVQTRDLYRALCANRFAHTSVNSLHAQRV